MAFMDKEKLQKKTTLTENKGRTTVEVSLFRDRKTSNRFCVYRVDKNNNSEVISLKKIE